MKTAHFSILAALGSLAITGTATADTLYSMMPQNCAIGVGGEGVALIGHGRFSVTESSYVRQGKLLTVGDGWTEAAYAPVYEGVPGDPIKIRLKVEEDQVTIRWPDGKTLDAARCR